MIRQQHNEFHVVLLSAMHMRMLRAMLIYLLDMQLTKSERHCLRLCINDYLRTYGKGKGNCYMPFSRYHRIVEIGTEKLVGR